MKFLTITILLLAAHAMNAQTPCVASSSDPNYRCLPTPGISDAARGAILPVPNGATPALTKTDFLKPKPLTQGKWKPFTGSMSIASIAVCGAGAVSDPLSTRGLNETNPLFRNEQGKIRMGRSLAIGIAPCAATYLLEKKSTQAATLIRFVYGAVKIGWTIHNLKEKHR